MLNSSIKTIEDVSENIRYGYTDKAKESGNAIFIRITDINSNGKFKNNFVYVDVSPKDLDKYQLYKNDILVARSGATAGKVAIYDLDKISVFASYLIRIQPNKDIFAKYLFYFCHSSLYWNQLDSIKVGGAQPNVNATNLKKIKLLVPSLKEQKRIVSKLDTLFVKIDKAIELHEKNVKDADAFMGSVLNEVFEKLEEKYEIKNIGSMLDLLTDYHSNGAYKTLKANIELLDNEEYALMIRATDLENEDYKKNVKFITEEAYHFMSKSKVYGGEIILPKIGSIGSVYFMPSLNRPVSLAMNIFMLRCSSHVDNKYLFLYLKSPVGNQNILRRANGAVTKTITKDAVKSITLPLPPLKIQQKIVKYLDEVSQKIEKIKVIQKEKLQNLKDLKASILDQAFKGEL